MQTSNLALDRIPITDVRPGDEMFDHFRLSLGTVRTVQTARNGVVVYTVTGSALPRHLSPWSPRGKRAGTVLIRKRG